MLDGLPAPVADQPGNEVAAAALVRREPGRTLGAGVMPETPIEDVRRQFDTNLFGLIRLTQLVLPSMRAARYGRIVNVSSIFGRLAVPGKAFDDASKFAVTGFTESLRLEVAHLGIGVAAVEPAATPRPSSAAASRCPEPT